MAKKKVKRGAKKQSKPAKKAHKKPAKKDIWHHDSPDDFHDHHEHVERLNHLHETHTPTYRFYAAMAFFVIVILLIPSLYLDALSDLKLVDIEVHDFAVNDASTWTIKGEFILENPRGIPVKYNAIDYFIYLGDEKVLLTEGVFMGTTIPKHSTAKVPFEAEIHQSPPFEVILALVERQEDLVQVKGNVQLMLGGFTFEKSVYVTDVLKTYLVLKVDEVVGQLDGIETDVPDVVHDLRNNLVARLNEI